MDDPAAPAIGVAAFDFDGTISRRDTLMGFLVAVGGRRQVGAALARHSATLVRGQHDDEARDAAKEAVVGQVLAGRSIDELTEAGRRYAGSLPGRFRPDTLSLIEGHREQGHRCVIVSASLVYYLRPAARSLGFDDVIGVEMEFDESSRCTGRLAGENVRGAEKERRLTSWLDGRFGADASGIELWAYGNSAGDDELLAMADHPVWVGRRADRNPGF